MEKSEPTEKNELEELASKFPSPENQIVLEIQSNPEHCVEIRKEKKGDIKRYEFCLIPMERALERFTEDELTGIGNFFMNGNGTMNFLRFPNFNYCGNCKRMFSVRGETRTILFKPRLDELEKTGNVTICSECLQYRIPCLVTANHEKWYLEAEKASEEYVKGMKRKLEG